MSILAKMYDSVNESIHDKHLFKAVFMAGGSGSGKSYISSVMFSGDAVFVNSDIAFETILKREDLPFEIDASNKKVYAKQVDARETAKKLTSTRMGLWINGMLPLIVDGTGKDYEKIEKQKNKLESIGYDTAMVFVNTSLEVALDRNANRKRKVDPEVAKEAWMGVQGNIGKFQNLFGAGKFIVIDNSKKLDGSEKRVLEIQLAKKAMALLKAPLENQVGKKILAMLKDKGKLYLSDLAGMSDK